jgi:hypothetical protein
MKAVLTNLTQHTAFVSKCADIDRNGYPKTWETANYEDGLIKNGLNANFKEIDIAPSFTDQEAFAPVFPADYVVSDVTSGRAVMLQDPHPEIKAAPARSDLGKRIMVFFVLGVVAIGPLATALRMKRKAALSIASS